MSEIEKAIAWLRKFRRNTYDTGFLWLSDQAEEIASNLEAELSQNSSGKLVRSLRATYSTHPMIMAAADELERLERCAVSRPDRGGAA